MNKPQKQDKSAKRRSTLGTLFNPDLGSSIRPLGENISQFVRMIAMIYAMAGLFPRNHPAITGQDPNARLSLGQILSTAFSNLRFTREGLPQVFFFCASILSAIVTLLIFVSLIFGIISGSAHATSVFEAPGGNGNCTSANTCTPSKDLAISWINYLFMGATPPSASGYFEVSDGAGGANPLMVLGGNALQQGLYTALAFYSNAVLVIASFLLLYHFLGMMAEQAQHGQVMGKRASQLWAPIRVVFALGLLVPVTGTGLNMSQYLVVQIAKWSTGVAGNIWQQTLVGISGSGFVLKPPDIPIEVNQFVYDLILMDACKMAWNAMIKVDGTGAYIPPYYSGYEVTEYAEGPSPYNTAATGVVGVSDNQMIFGGDRAEINRLCGYYVLKQPATIGASSPQYKTLSREIFVAFNQAFSRSSTEGQLIWAQIDGAAANVYKYFVYDRLSDASITALTSGFTLTDPRDAVLKIRDILSTKYSSVSSLANWKNTMSSLTNHWAEQGWVTAGAWFNTVARAQGAVLDAASSPIPVTSPPQPTDAKKDEADKWYWFGSHKKMISTYQNLDETLGAFKYQFMAFNGTKRTSADLADLTKTAAQGTEKSDDDISFSVLLWVIDKIGQFFGIWGAEDGFQTQYLVGRTGNPLAELQSMGHNYVRTGISLVSWAIVGKLTEAISSYLGASGKLTGALGTAAKALSKVFSGLSAVLLFFGGVFILCGFALCFVLPILPFIKFFFNVITWILNVFEALIAAPIFALAHMSPFGEGLPGDMARGGYFMILSIFLRPILMVFGLLAGLLIFMIAISFLNATYQIAVAGTGNAGGDLAVVSKVLYTVLYVALCYICANNCFKSISFFPEHIMNWINARGVEGRSVGDQGSFKQIVGAAGGYLGGQGLSKIAAGAGDMAGGMLSSFNKPDRTNADIVGAIQDFKERLAPDGNAAIDGTKSQLIGSEKDKRSEASLNNGRAEGLAAAKGDVAAIASGVSAAGAEDDEEANKNASHLPSDKKD